MKYFLSKAYEGGSRVITNGSGGKFLADDGTYKTIDVSGSGLTAEQIEVINHVLSDYNNGKIMSDENFTTTFKNKLDTLNGERDLEMRVNTTHLQWKYVGDTVWNNLISLDELRGFTVNIGETGQVLTKKSNTSGDWEFRQLTSADVGLSNVQNVDTTNIDNINESTTKKIMTDIERTKLSNAFIKDTDTTDSLTEGSTKLLLTTTEREKLNNLSGINTGDQDLSGLVPKTTTVNGYSLSSNIEIPLIDTIVSEGTGTSILGTKIENTQNIKGISGNGSINIVDDTVNKNIKIEVDESGLLFDNIPDGTLYKKLSYGKFDEITHANRTALDSVSGTNTGDETKASIETKLTGNIASHTHSYEPIITAGTTAQYYRGDKTFQTLDKTAVGLSNVTNDAQIKKIASSTTDNIVTFGATTGDVVKDSGKSVNNIAFKNEVNTFTEDVTIGGTLQVNGSIVQNGSTYETHAEQVYTKDNTIILRDGAVSGLGAGELVGFTAKLYDGTNDGQLVFDKDGTARVGDIGNTQAIATREETPLNGNVAVWDSASSKFVTSTGNTGTGSIVRANSPTFIGTVSGITSTMVGLGNVNNTADSQKEVLSATKLKTARNLTIGLTGKTFDGTTDVTWTLAEIGAAEKEHTHNYEPANVNIQSHISNNNNPHSVTKTQVGLGNVANIDSSNPANIAWNANYRTVTDTEKTTWNGKQNALGYTAENSVNKKTAWQATPDNTSYPSEKLVKDSLDLKVDKVTGKQLSTEDYTTTEKTKLSGIAAGANNYIHPTGDGNSHIPATGTTNNGKVLKAGTSANSASWSNVDWSEITNKPTSMPASDVYAWAKSSTKPTYTASEVGAADSSHDHAFADLTLKPTTLIGYGITDAVNSSNVAAGNSVGKIVQRDDSGDVICRLVRAEFADQATISGGLVFRTEGGSGTDNYLRVCTNAANIRTFLGVPSKVVATTSYNGLMSSTDKTKLDGITAGANNYTHPASGVSAGSYTKVTVDTNGHVTVGASLSASDIPSHDHTSITGNAATATKLQTARTINGVSFDGSVDITIPKIHSRGLVTCETGANRPAITGVSTQRCYANGYPITYGEVLTLDGGGSAQLLLGWAGSNTTAPAYIRSKRDVSDSLWSDWHMIYTTSYKPSLAELGASSSSHTHAFSELTSKPTTLTAYGITDAVNSSDVTALNTAGKIVQRDGSGDVMCRLVRAEYQNQSDISGGLVFRTEGGSGTDNYLRVCNNPSAIRTFLDTPSTAVATTSVNGLMSSTDKTKLDGLSNYVHPTSGVTAGTYRSVTVNTQGHITSGSNPTTLSGYGITDAVISSDSRLTNARPASDVYAWAKASTKPSYTYSEVGAVPQRVRTNWNSDNASLSSVVGQLAWKKYGNNFTIFDASAGTSPDETTVNLYDAAVQWTSGFPTLMGWNGANTCGVRVDSARSADNVQEYTVNIGRNDVANKIVITDSNGHIQAGWINTTSGDAGTNAISRIYASTDNFIRYYTPANFISTLNLVKGDDARLSDARTPLSHVHSVATQLENGFISAADKAKLDGCKEVETVLFNITANVKSTIMLKRRSCIFYVTNNSSVSTITTSGFNVESPQLDFDSGTVGTLMIGRIVGISPSSGTWYLERTFNSRDYNGGIRFSIKDDGTNLNLYCQSATSDAVRMLVIYT